MTTQQIDISPADRPLSEVDEVAERIQASTAERWDRPFWDAQDARDRMARAARDPRMIAGILAATVALIVLAITVGRRPPPRTAQDELFERTEEAFDRAREGLERIAAKLASLDR